MKALVCRGRTFQIIGQRFCIDDPEIYHHLIRVLRTKENEPIKVLDGNGLVMQTRLTSVTKSSIELSIEKEERTLDTRRFTLLVGITKRDNFEMILRAAIETNVKEIVPIQTDYSFDIYHEKILEHSHDCINYSERIKRVVESSMVQSNNPFYPIISSPIGLNQIFSMPFHPIVFLEPIEKSINQKREQKELVTPNAMMLGPEGGFSSAERDLLCQHYDIVSIPGPIMRSETCVSFGMGFLSHLCYNQS